VVPIGVQVYKPRPTRSIGTATTTTHPTYVSELVLLAMQLTFSARPVKLVGHLLFMILATLSSNMQCGDATAAIGATKETIGTHNRGPIRRATTQATHHAPDNIQSLAMRQLQSNIGTQCPAGTTATYKDGALAFRFQAEDITRDAATGSLVWNAIVPASLAFVMNRTIVNGSSEMMEMAQDPIGWFTGIPIVEPSIVSSANGISPTGLFFQPVAHAAMVMYANQTVAIGAKHTFFAVLTPSAGNIRFAETIIGFRAGGFTTGLFAWYAGYLGGENTTERTFTADTFSSCGFAGPILRSHVTQILIARSRYAVDAAGVAGPVIDMAVVDPSSQSSQISWVSKMYGAGMKQYAFEQSKNPGGAETFDLDFRDGQTDGDHVLAAGYMALGNMLPSMGFIFQYRGVIHNFELHSTTLSDAHVADVTQALKHKIMPGVSAVPPCNNCVAGMRDSDSDPMTPCEPCGRATYSAVVGATLCNGTCPVGRTIRTTGATSSAACLQCTAGQFGAIDEHANAVCLPCAAGRVSAQVGATSNVTCAKCSPGTYSVPAGSVCEPSGCTDSWANNYSPFAVVDEGLCTYACNTVRTLTNSSNAGGCVMHDPHLGWIRYTHENLLMNLSYAAPIPSGEDWVLQGRVQAGSRSDFPLYEPYPAVGHYSGGGHLTLRHVLLTKAQGEVWKFDTTAGAAIVDISDVRVVDNSLFTTGALFAQGEAKVRIGDSFMARNHATDSGGAARALGADVAMSWSRVHFEANQAQNTGGALSATDGAHMIVDRCAFIGNEAKLGAAVFVAESATGTLTYSIFRDNIATQIGGAGVAAQLGTVTVEHSMLIGSSAPGVGAALHLDRPPSIKILNTSFIPLLDGADTVFLAGRLGGCAEHPCDPGSQW
jgi:hypothetical protein